MLFPSKVGCRAHTNLSVLLRCVACGKILEITSAIVTNSSISVQDLPLVPQNNTSTIAL